MQKLFISHQQYLKTDGLMYDFDFGLTTDLTNHVHVEPNTVINKCFEEQSQDSRTMQRFWSQHAYNAYSS